MFTELVSSYYIPGSRSYEDSTAQLLKRYSLGGCKSHDHLEVLVYISLRGLGRTSAILQYIVMGETRCWATGKGTG